eukprot:1950942-Prymnesium_polylepis.2
MRCPSGVRFRLPCGCAPPLANPGGASCENVFGDCISRARPYEERTMPILGQTIGQTPRL